MTQTTVASSPRTARIPEDLARGYLYLLAGLPLGIASFVVAIVGLATGVGTLVIWVGLPILAGTLAAARGFGLVERALVEQATRRALPPSHHRAESGRGLGRLWSQLGDPQSWRDVLHAIVAFPVRIVTFALALAWGVGAVGGSLYVVWEWALPRGDEQNGLFALITGSESRFGDIALNTLLGFGLLATLPWMIRALVTIQSGLARVLLTNEEQALRARAAMLESSRRAATQAEAHMLRRVERDIHDGPQQRLVRLNMDLETVVRRLDDDPERARPLIEEALVQSREALAELRSLSRGIAPPILVDGGLGPALAAAAARCPVEVSLDVALPTKRLADAVESTAYFVVAEALTNVAKHSAASLCVVMVRVDGALLLVQVRDNGRGGAHLGKGHGLAGLADRLAVVDGSLDVVSPAGGPTVITADIPLAGLA